MAWNPKLQAHSPTGLGFSSLGRSRTWAGYPFIAVGRRIDRQSTPNYKLVLAVNLVCHRPETRSGTVSSDIYQVGENVGAPGRTRTPDPQIRSLML